MKSLFSSFSVSAYGAMIACALFLWLLFSLRASRMVLKSDRSSDLGIGSVLALFALAPLCGLAFSRITWCLVNFDEYMASPAAVLRIHEGGLSMWGFLIGFALSVRLYARALDVSAPAALDSFAPGMLLFVCMARLAEMFTYQGVGGPIGLSILKNPVFSAADAQGIRVYAVYRFEALWALLMMPAAMRLLRKGCRASLCMKGDVWRYALGSYSALQIVFEAMREDDLLMVSTLRVSQLISLAAAVVLAFWCMVRLKKCRALGAHAVWMVFFIAGGAALCAYAQFCMENAAVQELRFLVMLAGALLLFFVISFSSKRLLSRKPRMVRKARG